MDNPRYIPTAEEVKRLTAFLKIRSVPELDKLTIHYIEKVTGKSWNDEAVLEKIRNAVITQKESYWKEGVKKSVAYKGAYSVLGYMAYQMPGYVLEFSEFFANMVTSGLVRKNVRILDIGAGPGTVSVGVARVLSCLDGMTAEITALERFDTHIEAYLAIVPGFLKNAGDKVTAGKPLAKDITREIPEGEFDIIVCSNVINELTSLDQEKKAELVMNLSKHLASDGNLVLIEPADLTNATMLRDLSRDVKKRGLTIYAPCNDLRGVYCTVSPCWTFQSYEDIRPTNLMFALGGEEEKYRFVNTDVKFSYAILRTDGHRKCGYKIPGEAKRARLSQLKKHLQKRIHITVSVMSADIGDAKNYLFLVCDGTGTTPTYVALPAFHRAPEHEALLTASYGSVVAIDSVLVRFNKEQNAYNLLMGPESNTRMIAGVSTGNIVPDKTALLKEKYGRQPSPNYLGKKGRKPSSR